MLDKQLLQTKSAQNLGHVCNHEEQDGEQLTKLVLELENKVKLIN
jgi:hypothetical protein